MKQGSINTFTQTLQQNVVWWLFLAMISLYSGLANAQAEKPAGSAPPDLNWKVLCDAALGANEKGCALRINAQFMNDKTEFAGVGGVLFLRKQEPNSPFEMMVKLPITSQLNVPVYLTAPDGTPFLQLVFVSCGSKTTCSASAQVSPEVLTYLTEIKQDIWLSYTNAGKPVFLLLSMQSFAEQFAALQKQ